MEAPSWIYKNHSNIIEYYKSDTIRIYVIEGMEHNWHILEYFKSTDYIFIYIPCYFGEWNFNFGIKCLQYKNPNFKIENVIWMCPDIKTLNICNNLGYNNILCNHNCFLDENKFIIKENNKIYDAVMNCRPENWKRPYLAKEIKNLAILKGYNFIKDDYYDLNQLNPKFINNDMRLSPNEVANIYNQSKVGLIFSEKEGACYSSSEYLLCGLPVISTKSEGGRDIWYNDKNSIICEDNVESVLECVNKAIKNLDNGYFNSNEIRNMHIKMSMEHRKNMIDMVSKIFEKYNINEDSSKLFYNNLMKSDKMKSNMSINDAIQMLSLN